MDLSVTDINLLNSDLKPSFMSNFEVRYTQMITIWTFFLIIYD